MIRIAISPLLAINILRNGGVVVVVVDGVVDEKERDCNFNLMGSEIIAPDDDVGVMRLMPLLKYLLPVVRLVEEVLGDVE